MVAGVLDPSGVGGEVRICGKGCTRVEEGRKYGDIRIA